jgi:RNAse (barnase) inhibitor barstar
MGDPQVTAVILRGQKMRSHQGMFDEFAAALQFPYYFGENWNALNDCLRDLEWLRKGPVALFVMDAVHVLAQADAADFGGLVGLLGDVAEEWSHDTDFSAARPFHTILHASSDEAPALARRLSALETIVPEL